MIFRYRKRLAGLERELGKRDQAIRTSRRNVRAIELKAASFGLDRILDPRLAEIEVLALQARAALSPKGQPQK